MQQHLFGWLAQEVNRQARKKRIDNMFSESQGEGRPCSRLIFYEKKNIIEWLIDLSFGWFIVRKNIIK